MTCQFILTMCECSSAQPNEKTGTKSIKYSIDGGPMTEYSSPRTLDISERDTFTESKVYDVKVETEDMLGNTSTKEHKFIVKN